MNQTLARYLDKSTSSGACFKLEVGLGRGMHILNMNQNMMKGPDTKLRKKKLPQFHRFRSPSFIVRDRERWRNTVRERARQRRLHVNAS